MNKEEYKERYLGGALKGSLFDDLDVPYLACMLTAIMLFILFVSWIKSADYTQIKKINLERLPPRMVKVLMPKKAIANQEAKSKTLNTKKTSVEKKIPTSTSSVGNTTQKISGSPAERIESAKKSVAAKGARVPGEGQLQALEEAPGSYVKTR